MFEMYSSLVRVRNIFSLSNAGFPFPNVGSSSSSKALSYLREEEEEEEEDDDDDDEKEDDICLAEVVCLK